jgi:hypothetical protein
MMNGQTALLRVRQMAEADRLTVAAGTSAIDMMERAGGAVAREIRRRWKVRPVIVLCGPGNNGGDGFVAARHLVEARWPVRIALLGPRDHLAGEARRHAERWRSAVEPLAPAVLDGAELVVDAIFGAQGSAARLRDRPQKPWLPPPAGKPQSLPLMFRAASWARYRRNLGCRCGSSDRHLFPQETGQSVVARPIARRAPAFVASIGGAIGRKEKRLAFS